LRQLHGLHSSRGFLVACMAAAECARSRSATRPDQVWRGRHIALMRRLAFNGAAFFEVYLPDMADGFRQQIAPLLFRTKQD
jgi:hypothetical protein